MTLTMRLPTTIRRSSSIQKWNPSYTGLGEAYLAKNDPDRAIVAYDQAIRLEPKIALTYVERGKAFLARNDLYHAIADCDQAISLDPKNVRAYVVPGQALEAKNDPDLAIADYDRALKVQPSLDTAKLRASPYTAKLQQALDAARAGYERMRILLAKRDRMRGQ
jgi:tetratricopeptide (TPR) repeat protein